MAFPTDLTFLNEISPQLRAYEYVTVDVTDQKTQNVVYALLSKSHGSSQAYAFDTSAEREHYIRQLSEEGYVYVALDTLLG